MIRMIASGSAGHAKAYFSDALVQSDYYLNDQELQGRFEGKLAERLGIAGPATKEAFFALCENREPGTGKNLTPRKREDRITGYDINFHCPKSVSLLHVLSKDNHILEAFEASVAETMQDIEAASKTRVRKGVKPGQYDDRETGELAWASFTHQTARPVGGQAPDPHLHSHCFVFNATWDAQEGRIKAAKFRDIKRDMPYYQARFHKRLADRIAALGYRIQPTAHSFEIKGVPKEVVAHFSKRTDEIGRAAKEKGITNAKDLDALGARTRGRKQKGLSMAELKEEWRGQIRRLHQEAKIDPDRTVRHGPARPREKLDPQLCIDHAVAHCFERASVMEEKRLLQEAYRFAMGHEVSVEAITDAYKADKRLLHIPQGGRRLCTTKEVLREEKRMVDLARRGVGAVVPLYRDVPPLILQGQQGEAVKHVLTTANRVSIIRGAAGAGKTTLMHEAIDKIEAAGKRVTVVAPTAQAAKSVLASEGFEKPETVAKLLIDQKMQKELEGQVLWVDEAGLLGTKDMTALLQLATDRDARLILGGDTRQHASVARGDALRILNTVGGIKTAEVSKIFRQKGATYRAAVNDLAKGDVSSGFEKLDGLGAIKKGDAEHFLLAEDYAAALKKGKTVLAVCPTNAEGEKVTEAIRQKLREAGMIGKKELQAKRLVNLNLTEAEKADARNFAQGQKVQFSQHLQGGIKRGSVWNVREVKDRDVFIEGEGGFVTALPRHKAKDYDVFEETQIGLSKGDRVRITRNGFDKQEKRLNNGMMLEVVSVSKKKGIVLQNKVGKGTYRLDQDFGHIAHAHCVTSHASQGKTVDEVFIAQPAATFTATNAKQFYVSVSRGREEVHLYTDDKEELLHHAAEIGDRQSALELVSRRKDHGDYVQEKQRANYGGRAKESATKEKDQTITIERDYGPE